PRTEASFNGADVISPFALVGAPRRYGAIFSEGFAPIFKQVAVLDAHVGSVRLLSRSPNSITPTGKALRDEVLRDSRERDEFRQRWRASHPPCHRSDGIQNVLFNWHWSKEARREVGLNG